MFTLHADGNVFTGVNNMPITYVRDPLTPDPDAHHVRT